MNSNKKTPLSSSLSSLEAADTDAASDAGQHDPNRLLDGLIARMHLENDAALANKLQVIQPIIRMIRDGRLSMTEPNLLALIQEATGISLPELLAMMRGEAPR